VPGLKKTVAESNCFDILIIFDVKRNEGFFCALAFYSSFVGGRFIPAAFFCYLIEAAPAPHKELAKIGRCYCINLLG
jgi:hypothetical protein